jgi:hypothetical protein
LGNRICPSFQGRAAHTVPAGDVLLIRAVVVEEIEFDESDALVFRVEKCAVHAHGVGTEEPNGFRARVAASPAPRLAQSTQGYSGTNGLVFPAAHGSSFLDLAQESLIPNSGDRQKTCAIISSQAFVEGFG